jgi:putative mRNA 3-end processing factor
MGLITFTDCGFYCEQGNFYIDPWKPVDYAILTHGHSDHARWGMKKYLAHDESIHILKARLGADAVIETMPYGEVRHINGVKVSLHPAGHIVGSAQVRIEGPDGETWCISGDYKVDDDGISTLFEPVRCHHFVTESTFGLPIYQWDEQAAIMQRMHEWIQGNQARGRNSVLVAYTLGKSQRIVHGLAKWGYQIYAHGATVNMHKAVQPFRPQLPDIHHLTKDTPKEGVAKGVILCPGSAVDSGWLKRLYPYAVGSCSGWMQVRGAQRRRNADAGFVLSDHADWPGLLDAVAATGAESVWATHGFSDVLSRYLREERGIAADVVRTEFGDETEET